MGSKMLIDASQPEETRVVVVQGNRVETFEFESALRKQLKGNIYLAKVTRVEPSLQAAFVEYGGNRHGFLPLSEIHPDYYQIPLADRLALLEEEAADAAEFDDDDDDDEDDAPVEAVSSGDGDELEASSDEEPQEAKETQDAQTEEPDTEEPEAHAEPGDEDDGPTKGKTQAADSKLDERLVDGTEPANEDETVSDDAPVEAQPAARDDDDASDGDASDDDASDDAELEARTPDEDDSAETDDNDDGETAEAPEETGGDDEDRESDKRRERRRQQRLRRYRIQEVIKRRQILLIQVVKEERGNKGAALTTYLSIAGRYCVLMPNTARGGGISRKITNAADRKRLKTITKDLDVPKGMGLILRTAGAQRTKAEVKRDFEYLLRLWDNIRELTLKSVAPCLIYEEGNIIQRAIRDFYSKDIDQVLVEGEDGYKEAKAFMKMLMPSHAKNVQLYKERGPLFLRYQVENQLEQMFEPIVSLKSGGYIVINPTEALISIDVNSGKSTREKNVEDTAHRTNVEAAEEIARQLRLRDLAGLIVIDFIDMEENRHKKAVERKLKECLKSDRARIQVGRISSFGLLEMSRQRLGSSLLEIQTTQCDHCGGTGMVRTTDAAALKVLRAVEDEAMRGRASEVKISLHPDVAVYVLNNKREQIARIHSDYGLSILFDADDDLPRDEFEIDRIKNKSRQDDDGAAITADALLIDKVLNDDAAEDEPQEAARSNTDDDDNSDDKQPRKRRRRRRRRRKSGDKADGQDNQQAQSDDQPDNQENGQSDNQADEQSAETADAKSEEPAAEAPPAEAQPADKPQAEAEPELVEDIQAQSEPKPVADVQAQDTPAPEPAQEQAASHPEPEPEPEPAPEPEKPAGPPRKGWWNRNILGG